MTMPVSIHEHPEEWLATALADGLSPEERRALDEHLAGCERCRALQAEYAALDEMLLRDLPAAVGPAGGFETRLVADFRRRVGMGGQLARLRALAGWLLRQRGVQFAGVAAALVALVGTGQMLTRSRSPLPDIRNKDGSVEIESRFVEVTQSNLSELGFDWHLGGFTEGGDIKDQRAATNPGSDKSSVIIAGSGAVSEVNMSRDATPLRGNLSLGAGSTSIDDLARRAESPSDVRSLTLSGANTYSGNTTVSAGTLTVNGTAFTGGGQRFQDSSTGKTHDFDGFINYGSPIQNSSTNALGIAQSNVLTQNTINQPVFSVRKPSDPSFNFAGAPVPPSDAPATNPPATPAPPDVRKLVRNARAELEVAAFDAAVDAVTAAATRDGGFLDTRNSARGPNGKMSGTLVVKVLPENLDRFLAGLRTLGEVKNQTVQTEDVTKDYYDTDARLRNARRMEDRLLKMLDEVKGKMSEVLQVEKELARVRADIETMQGQLKLYDAQVRYATVTLGVREKNLDQPAAFLLRETATLSLLAADVEKTAAETRRIADAARAQVLRSELSRDGSGQWRATLRLLIGTDAAPDVIAKVKALGRVGNFNIQDERNAQNGTATAETGTDPAKVERAPVAFDITISHDEQISRQVSFTLVATDAEGAFEKARAAALAAGGEIVNANVAHSPDGHANATLAVRVPSAAEAGLLATLQTLGRAGKVETRRVNSNADASGGPVLVELSVVDVEPAVQDTVVQVRTDDVERRAADIKREAAAAHADVEGSSFSSEGDGRQRAALKFRLPMSAYPAFIERVRALGTVKEFAVRREDRPGKTPGSSADGDASAPATVELSLYSEGPVVNANSGLGATLRRTFGQGIDALAWSVQMIGVALAFLAPWAVLLTAVVAGARWWRRQRSARAGQGKSA